MPFRINHFALLIPPDAWIENSLLSACCGVWARWPRKSQNELPNARVGWAHTARLAVPRHPLTRGAFPFSTEG
jgi:hypothetical protein